MHTHRLRLLWVFALFFASLANAANHLTVTGLTLQSKNRVSRTAYEYTYTASIINSGADVIGVKVTASSPSSNTTIVDGLLTFGDVAAGTTVTSFDTITIRQDRRSRFNPKSLIWNVATTPTTGTLLQGAPNLTVEQATQDYVATIPYAVSEVGTDANGNDVLRTEIEIEFEVTATVNEINTILQSINGVITGMLQGDNSLVIRIPDPGDLQNLDTLITTLEQIPMIRLVYKSVFPNTNELPGNPSFQSIPLTNLDDIKHHLAIRMPAAWNAKDRLNLKSAKPPVVIIIDYFGDDLISQNGYSAKLTPSEFSKTGYTGGNGPNDGHGYHVLGILAGSYGGFSSTPADRVTGSYPGSNLTVRVVDLFMNGNLNAEKKAFEIAKKEIDSGSRVILSTSLATGVFPSDNAAIPDLAGAYVYQNERDAVAWIHDVRNVYKIDGDLLHITAAGNLNAKSGTGAAYSAIYASRYNAAALANLTNPYNGLSVQNLSNTLVVENRFPLLDAQNVYVDGCTSSSSKLPGNISAIGTDVHSICNGTYKTCRESGTSMATPQVAGLAAYLWALEPTLTPHQVIKILSDNKIPNTCASPINGAPAIDAYHTLLSLDTGVSVSAAKTRMSILDVVRENWKGPDNVSAQDDNITPDGKFGLGDLRRFVQEFLNRGVTPDYSRFDLNGDGFTGGAKALMPGYLTRFDLDGNGIIDSSVTQIIENVTVTFDENNVSDEEILCYYAYSTLFDKGSVSDLSERTIVMIPILHECGVTLTVIDVALKDWSTPTVMKLHTFGIPLTFSGLWTGNGSCGGEQGTPVWSSNVNIGAHFIPVGGVQDHPGGFGFFSPGCSSFIAVSDGRIWFNATAISPVTINGSTFDREYQVRHYSDPNYVSGNDPTGERKRFGILKNGWVDLPGGTFFEFESIPNPTVEYSFHFF